MAPKFAPKPPTTTPRHFIAGRRVVSGDEIEVHLGRNRWLAGRYRTTTAGAVELELVLRSGKAGRLQIPAGASLRWPRR